MREIRLVPEDFHWNVDSGKRTPVASLVFAELVRVFWLNTFVFFYTFLSRLTLEFVYFPVLTAVRNEPARKQSKPVRPICGDESMWTWRSPRVMESFAFHLKSESFCSNVRPISWFGQERKKTTFVQDFAGVQTWIEHSDDGELKTYAGATGLQELNAANFCVDLEQARVLFGEISLFWDKEELGCSPPVWILFGFNCGTVVSLCWSQLSSVLFVCLHQFICFSFCVEKCKTSCSEHRK